MEVQLTAIINSVYPADVQTEEGIRKLVEVGRQILEVRRNSHGKPTFWIDLEDVLKWLADGAPKNDAKSNAKKRLKNRLIEGVDYQVSDFSYFDHIAFENALHHYFVERTTIPLQTCS